MQGFANGIGTVASFYYPSGITMNAAGTFALVVRGKVSLGLCFDCVCHTCACLGLRSNLQSDWKNSLIRSVVIATGTVTTLAGVGLSPGTANGVGSVARFTTPVSVGMDVSSRCSDPLACDYSQLYGEV